MNEAKMIEEDEISIFDLINPLIARWKAWVGAACVGLVVGAAFWASKGFDAELAAHPVRTLEFSQWRSLSNGLPALAEHLRETQSTSPERKALYDVISQPGWWVKNVTPEYTYTKSDIKELNLSDKQLGGTTSINRLVIRARGTSRDDALRMVRDIERHIREGGVYIAAKSLLSQYALDSQDIYQKLQAKISKDMVELEYLNKRAEGTESLQKRYPDNEKIGAQGFLDTTNAAKYLPIGTQLVAIKTEINAVEESLSRSRDRLEEQKVIQQFLSMGLPLLETETAGFALLAKLFEVEKEMRRSVDTSDLRQILALNLIAEKLAGIEVSYGRMFEENSLVTARRAPKLPMALGSVAGLLLGVVWVLFSDTYRRARLVTVVEADSELLRA